MKRFFLVVMILASAASVYAAELKVSGDMNVRGVMDGFTPDVADAYSYNFFDYDLTINAALVANENATVFTRLAFDKSVVGDFATTGDGQVADSGAITGVDTSTGDVEAVDATLALERAYINYKFFPFLQVNTGLMGGGQWAGAFSDNEINVMRVQFIGALSEDMIFILTYQKDEENALTFTPVSDVADYEKAEQTTYYASAILKFGAIKVTPLFIYVDKGLNYGSEVLAGLIAAGVPAAAANAMVGGNQYDASVYVFDLGLSGDFGMVGFEFEGVYRYTDTAGLFDDINDVAAGTAQAAGIYEGAQYGVYVDVFAKIEPAKVGVAFEYCSSDEDAGSFESGDDLDFTMVVDDLKWGANNGLAGFMVGKLYGEVKAMEKLTVGAAFAYGKTTNTDVSERSFWEIDASAAWAFDANATYSVAFGYASMTDDDAVGDYTASQYRLYHKFEVKF